VDQHGSENHQESKERPKKKTLVTGKRFKEKDSVNYHGDG
jgi:hypothetical protein